MFRFFNKKYLRSSVRKLSNRVRFGAACQDLDENTVRLVDFNRRRWPSREGGDGVVLVGLFSWAPSICAYSYLGNHLAEKLNCRLETYNFGRATDPMAKLLFESFGAPLTLDWNSVRRHENEARELAAKAFGGLRSKDEVFRICYRDVVIGDLIYDSYLRYYYQATANITDPQLQATMEKAFGIALACDEYFTRNKVRALLPYDAPYIESGVVHRFAVHHGVPIYAVEYNPFTLHQMDTRIRPGDRADYRNWPAKLPLWNFSHEVFAKLDPEMQRSGQERASKALNEHLKGKIGSKVLGQFGVPMQTNSSAFREPGTEAIFPNTGKPRILVLLHDFCDAPNVYRWALFPDFMEWIEFLLNKAAETDFEWYVKPHPNVHIDRRMNEANEHILADLQARYPNVPFLSRKASNRQIIAEGIDAMFTVCGTAAHEFAYCDVPVVTAGDNPQIEYEFNLHARTKEQLAEYIRTADRLSVPIDKGVIEQFYYLYHFHPYEYLASGVSILPDAWLKSREQAALESSTDIFRHFVESHSAERDAKVANYIDAFIALRAAENNSAPEPAMQGATLSPT